MDAAAIIYRIGAQQCILLIQLAVELVVGAIQLQFHAGSRTAHHQFEFTLRQGGRRGERLSEASLSGSYQQLRRHPCCSQRPGPSTVPSGSRPLGSLEHDFPGSRPYPVDYFSGAPTPQRLVASLCRLTSSSAH